MFVSRRVLRVLCGSDRADIQLADTVGQPVDVPVALASSGCVGGSAFETRWNWLSLSLRSCLGSSGTRSKLLSFGNRRRYEMHILASLPLCVGEGTATLLSPAERGRSREVRAAEGARAEGACRERMVDQLRGRPPLAFVALMPSPPLRGRDKHNRISLSRGAGEKPRGTSGRGGSR